MIDWRDLMADFHREGQSLGVQLIKRLALCLSRWVVISDLGAFVSDDGMIFSTLDENDLFWSVD